MAKYQYRISTDGNWQSMFGHALFSIVNISGSGKKLTLRSLEAQINSIMGSALTQTCKATLYKTTSIIGGEDMSYHFTRYDTSVAFPSTVKITRYSSPATITTPITAYSTNRFGAAAGTQNTLNNHKSWGKLGSLYRNPGRDGASVIEPITVRQNESVSLMPTVLQNTSCVRVSVSISVDGKTSTCEYVANTLAGVSIFSLANTGTSIVKILSIGLQEVGTTDTPYLRLVPIGQIYQSYYDDVTNQVLTSMPMNSTYPALSNSVLRVYTDVGFIPQGVPESYIAQASAGTPKGYNYLHTKDFDGPCFKVFFPEMEAFKPGAAAEDMLGHNFGFKERDIGVLKSNIILNPGEGLAIVASAETAVGVQASFSGWTSLNFSAQVDVEPLVTPYINLTGLVSGSDVVILDAGTTNVRTSVDSLGSNSFSWAYDSDFGTMYDVCVYKPGYVPLALRNINAGTSGISIPIVQVADRNYS